MKYINVIAKLIILQIYLGLSFAYQDVEFVYNSIPYQTINLQDLNGSSNSIKVSSLTGIAVVGAGNAGIMIIDNQFKMHIYESPDKSYIQSVQITSDAKHILAGMEEALGIFQFDLSTFKLVQIYALAMPGFVISDMEFNLDQTILFIVGYYGSLNWYDIRDMKNLVFLGQYSDENMLFWNGLLSPGGNIFYLAADEDGLLAFIIEQAISDNAIKMSLTRVLKKPAVSSFIDIAVTQSNQYIFAVDRWNGIYLIYPLTSLVLSGDTAETTNNNNIQMVQANFQNQASYTNTIGISSDDQYLYFGARSIGIMIYNINDPLNPNFFQQLQLTGLSVCLTLSPKLNQTSNVVDPFDNQYIYYANSVNVVVYEKQKPQLYREIPNLFNSQQSQFFSEGQGSYKWRCYVSPNSQYLYGAYDQDSLSIFSISINNFSSSSPQPSTLQLQYQFSDTLQQLVPTNTFRQFGPSDSVPLGLFVESIQFTSNYTYMYFPSQNIDMNVIAYKFQIFRSLDGVYTFQFIKALQYDQIYYCEEINMSVDELHAVMSFDVGILLVDLAKFEVVSMYKNTGVIGTCCGAVLSHDKKHALAVVRNVGLFIYDTSDITNPLFIKKWRTNGGETLIRSKTNSIIYLVDGFNGLILLDSSKLPEIVVIGSYKSPGWTNFITFTINENYGIISTMDTGTLTLIDLTDKTNLRVIMKSTISGQNSQSSCSDPTGLNFFFMDNSEGVRLYPLQSQVMLHVEKEVAQTSTQVQRSMDGEESFLIGMSYLIHFVSLYRQENQINTGVYYYNNLMMNDLPSWITVDNTQQSDPNLQIVLEMTVPKEALDSSGDAISFLILVVKTCFQLNSESFVFSTSDLTTTADESLSIFKFLKQNIFIDGNNCTTDTFDPIQKQYINLSDLFSGTTIDPNRLTTMEVFVTETLKHSTAYNQFVFNVISSLSFNQTNTSSMVSAVQTNIVMTLSFTQGSPFIFIQKLYSDLVMYLNNELTEMIMQGNIDKLNIALKNGILYYDQSKTNTTVNYPGTHTISVIISDNYNYNLNYTLNVPEAVSFLKPKSQIVLNIELQDQVNKQYSSAQLTIQEQFLIQFDKESFLDPDGVSLTYQFQEEVSGQYVTISTDSFIKYDNVNLRLVGTPPSSLLFTSYNLRLVVSNGYTSTYSDFYLKLNLMPFSYVLNVLIQVLGPLAFILGIYRKRSSFMNVFFKNSTMYSTETAYVNELYRKKIAILDYNYEIANTFLIKFINERVKKTQNNSFNQFGKSTQKIITLEAQLSPKKDTTIPSQQQLQLPFTSHRQEIFLTPTHSDTQFPQIGNENDYTPTNQQQPKLKSIGEQEECLSQAPVQKDTKDINLIPQTKEQSKELAQKEMLRYYIRKIKNFKNKNKTKLFADVTKLNQTKLNQTNEMDKPEQIQQTNQGYQQQQRSDGLQNLNDKNYTLLRNLVYDRDGVFNIEYLITLMIESKLKISYNLESYSIESYQNELLNEHSRFYKCLKANIIRMLIEKDKVTLYMYRFMKNYAIQKGGFMDNDWYKMYVTVVATNEVDRQGVAIPFSSTELKENVIFHVAKLLQIIPNELPIEQFNLSQLSMNQINVFLLQEDALGLQFVSLKSILKCNGDSIHQENHKISSVEAYQILKNGMCLCLRKPFNLQYKSLPVSKYFSLPSWMSYDYKNGVIMLEGVPSIEDVNHLLIRVYDQIHFACYQFHLKIEINPDSKAVQTFSPRQTYLQQQEKLQSSQQYDEKQQFFSSDNRLLQHSQIQLNRAKSFSQMAINSIFKQVALKTKPSQYQQQKPKHEGEIEIDKNSQNLQAIDIEVNSRRNNSKQVEEQEDDQTDRGGEEIMSINEMSEYIVADQASPPMFPQMPKFKGDHNLDYNTEHLKLDFKVPSVNFINQNMWKQQQQMKSVNRFPDLKQVDSVIDQH